jgi:hypothetical protein
MPEKVVSPQTECKGMALPRHELFNEVGEFGDEGNGGRIK